MILPYCLHTPLAPKEKNLGSFVTCPGVGKGRGEAYTLSASAAKHQKAKADPLLQYTSVRCLMPETHHVVFN